MNLRTAFREADWSACTDALKEEVGAKEDLDLLPLLTSLLEHIAESDLVSQGALAPADCGPGRPTQTALPLEARGAVLRACFGRDAALALQKRLLAGYRSPAFLGGLARLQAQWCSQHPEPPAAQRSRDVENLCRQQVLCSVLPQFGFPMDADVQEIMQPFSHDFNVAAMQRAIQKALSVNLIIQLPLPWVPDYQSLDVIDSISLAVAAMLRNPAAKCPAECFFMEAQVQTQVLSVLGIGEGGTVGQEPLQPDHFLNLVDSGCGSLATKLMGKNSFCCSFLPLLERLTSEGLWPAVCLALAKKAISDLPTLELCAVICTRILCVAQRLRVVKRYRQLIFLGIGAADALVEACIALHLGKVLGQDVSLQEPSPLTFRFGEDFEILFIVTDGSGRERSATHMEVLRYSMNDAVRLFATLNTPLFIFSRWPPELSGIHSLVESATRNSLEELCILRSGFLQAEEVPATLGFSGLEVTELFPKTLGVFDFLTRDDNFDADDPGLCHAHIHSYTPINAPPPHLAPVLAHTMGSFTQRDSSGQQRAAAGSRTVR